LECNSDSSASALDRSREIAPEEQIKALEAVVRRQASEIAALERQLERESKPNAVAQEPSPVQKSATPAATSVAVEMQEVVVPGVVAEASSKHLAVTEHALAGEAQDRQNRSVAYSDSCEVVAVPGSAEERSGRHGSARGSRRVSWSEPERVIIDVVARCPSRGCVHRQPLSEIDVLSAALMETEEGDEAVSGWAPPVVHLDDTIGAELVDRDAA